MCFFSTETVYYRNWVSQLIIKIVIKLRQKLKIKLEVSYMMYIILPSLHVENRKHTQVLMHVCIWSAKQGYVSIDV